MSTVVYSGGLVDFKDIFYPYCKIREGYRTQLYKDIKGYDTIGIGHKVTGQEPFAITATTVLTDRQVRQLFDMDYDRLKIEGYVSEIRGANYNYNMMLAVAHFVWMHGDGDYKGSQLRGGLLGKTFNGTTIQTYLAANWDVNAPKLQAVNKKNFEVGFSPTAWEAGFTFSLLERFTWLFPRLADFLKNNKVAVTIIAVLLIAIAVFFYWKNYIH
jgi:GH24 family phage-related lysozyme (muramidase)